MFVSLVLGSGVSDVSEVIRTTDNLPNMSIKWPQHFETLKLRLWQVSNEMVSIRAKSGLNAYMTSMNFTFTVHDCHIRID